MSPESGQKTLSRLDGSIPFGTRRRYNAGAGPPVARTIATIGAWRSLGARVLWVHEVASSNLAAPTRQPLVQPSPAGASPHFRHRQEIKRSPQAPRLAVTRPIERW